MNRREFFRSLAVGAAAAPLATVLAKPGLCARANNHSGPCNGYPRDTCRRYAPPKSPAQKMVQLVADQALKMVQARFATRSFATCFYEPELGMALDTINIPLAPILWTNCVGGGVETRRPQLGNAQFVLKHAEACFTTSRDNRYGNVTTAVTTLCETIERDLFALRGFDLVRLGDLDSWIETLDRVETKFFNERVPQHFIKYLVVDRDAWGGRLPTAFRTYLGPVTLIKNFWVFTSPFADNIYLRPKALLGRNFSTSVEVSRRRGLAFTEDAFGLVTRRLPDIDKDQGAVAAFAESEEFGLRAVMSYSPKTLGQHFTIDILYGAGILRQNHGVEIV